MILYGWREIERKGKKHVEYNIHENRKLDWKFSFPFDSSRFSRRKKARPRVRNEVMCSLKTWICISITRQFSSKLNILYMISYCCWYWGWWWHVSTPAIVFQLLPLPLVYQTLIYIQIKSAPASFISQSFIRATYVHILVLLNWFEHEEIAEMENEWMVGWKRKRIQMKTNRRELKTDFCWPKSLCLQKIPFNYFHYIFLVFVSCNNNFSISISFLLDVLNW